MVFQIEKFQKFSKFDNLWNYQNSKNLKFDGKLSYILNVRTVQTDVNIRNKFENKKNRVTRLSLFQHSSFEFSKYRQFYIWSFQILTPTLCKVQFKCTVFGVDPNFDGDPKFLCKPTLHRLISSFLKVCWITSQVTASDFFQIYAKFGIVKFGIFKKNMTYVPEWSPTDIQLRNCTSRCNNIVYYFSSILRTKNESPNFSISPSIAHKDHPHTQHCSNSFNDLDYTKNLKTGDQWESTA